MLLLLIHACCTKTHIRPRYLVVLIMMLSVASGWVTHGMATADVTPLFFPEKPGDLSFFAHRCQYITIAFYCFHSGVTPSSVSPHPFFTCLTSFSTILCKFAHKNFSFGCHSPWRVSSGAVRPPRLPLSDATGCYVHFIATHTFVGLRFDMPLIKRILID